MLGYAESLWNFLTDHPRWLAAIFVFAMLAIWLTLHYTTGLTSNGGP